MSTGVADNPAAQPPTEASWGVPHELSIWLIDHGDGWECLCEDFSIVGRGQNPEAAQREMLELLTDYANLAISDGESYEQARRPISRSRRVRLKVMQVAGRLRRRVRHARLQFSAARHPAHC